MESAKNLWIWQTEQNQNKKFTLNLQNIPLNNVLPTVFKGIYFITSDKDYPDATINMYKILSKENRRTIKILGITIENKEISSKEYLQIGNILCNKLLLKFGTGVKQSECYKLQKKIGKILLERLKAESSLD